MKLGRLGGYAWAVLGINIFVILWGAFVRATGSGAGCGSHWPSCNGEVIPWEPQTATLIEFTHRVTSGLALIMVIILMIWAFRNYPRGHRVRGGAALSLVFIIVEALVGAALVLFEWVAYDTSTPRAFVAAGHLVNTYILVAVLTLTAWWASGGAPVRWKGQGWLGWAFGFGFGGMLLLGASGAVAALGNLLFPVGSLAEGLRLDFSSTAHFLIRLRVSHPVIAIFLGVYLIFLMNVFNTNRATPLTRRIARIFTGLYVIQLMGGALNVVLLAPVVMQLIHLFLSDLVLILFVLFWAAAFAQPTAWQVQETAAASRAEEKVYRIGQSRV